MTRELKIQEIQLLKDARDAESLVKFLKDEDIWVRATARYAMVQIGRPAIPEIERALQDEDEGVRCRACEALAELGDAEAVPALTQVALEDPDKWVRERACAALGHICDPSALPTLYQAVKDEAWEVRVVAGWAIDQIRRKTRLDNIPRLREAGDVATLVDILADEDEYIEVHIAAIQALGQLADPSAIPALNRALQGPNKFRRAAAAHALAQIGAPAVPVLLQALKHPNPIWNPHRAELAHESLVQMGRHAVPSLIQSLQDEDHWVRAASAEALGAIADPSAVPSLIQSLQDEDHWVRAASAEALGAIADPSAVPALERALKDPYGTVQKAAREALKKIRAAHD